MLTIGAVLRLLSRIGIVASRVLILKAADVACLTAPVTITCTFASSRDHLALTMDLCEIAVSRLTLSARDTSQRCSNGKERLVRYSKLMSQGRSKT